MIVWAAGGIAVGWFLATRLRVEGLALVLVSSSIVPAGLCLEAHHFDAGALWGQAVFWVTAQGVYLAANLLGDRDRPDDRDFVEAGRGDEHGRAWARVVAGAAPIRDRGSDTGGGSRRSSRRSPG